MSCRHVAPRLFIALLAAGCGEPLVSPAFLGQQLFEVGGSVVQRGGRIPASHGELTLSLFWIGAGEAGGVPPVEQSAELGAGLASFSLTLFDPPPAEASTFGDLRGDQRHLALAVIALYADADANGRLDPGTDLILGSSAQHIIGWADAPVPAGSRAAKLLGAVPAGFQLLEYDRVGTCALLTADACQGEGHLRAVTASTTVELSLYDDPAAVRVPSPALEGQPNIWAVR